MITKIALEDIPCPYEREGNSVRRDVKNFLDFGYEAAEIDLTRYKSVRSAREGYFSAVVKMDLEDQIAVVRRGKRMFLVRKA